MSKFFQGIFFIIIGFTSAIQGQQEPLIGHSAWIPMQSNPAYVGLQGSHWVQVIVRKQWAGWEGTPTSSVGGYQVPIFSIGGGVGLDVFVDQIGVIRHTGIGLAASKYFYPGSDQQTILSFGGKVHLGNLHIDGNKILTPEGNYTPGQINHQDDVLNNGNSTSGTYVNLDLGTYFQSGRWKAGIFMNQLLKSKVSGFQSDPVYMLRRNYQAGLAFELLRARGGRKVDLFSQLITDLTNTQLYSGCTFQWDMQYGGLLAFRGYNNHSVDAIAGGLKVRIGEKLHFSYIYEVGISSLSTAHQGSHEVGITLEWGSGIGKHKALETIYTPRFL